MDIIKQKKPKLIQWLRGNDMILQYVQSEDFITDTEYVKLKDIQPGDKKNTELLDMIMQKGQSVCYQFLDLLKNKDVNESSPELRDWIATVNTSGPGAASGARSSSEGKAVHIQADGGSIVIAPLINNSRMGNCSINVNTSPTQCIENANNPNSRNQTIADNKEFLRKNRSALIDNVKNVVRIIDDLGLSDEMRANVQAETTDHARMRKVLDYINSTTAAERLVTALWKHAGDVMDDLTSA